MAEQSQYTRWSGAWRWAAFRPMTIRRILAQNLRRVRQERSLTQEELADLAGINRNYVGMIEREENAATVDVLEALAKALSIEAADLLAKIR